MQIALDKKITSLLESKLGAQSKLTLPACNKRCNYHELASRVQWKGHV